MPYKIDEALFDQLDSLMSTQNFKDFLDLIKKIPVEKWKQLRNAKGQTLLHRAIAVNNKDVFKYLMLELKPVDINIEDNSGNTPLMLAVNSKACECKKLYQYYSIELITKKADLRKRFPNSDTLLHVAAINNYCKVTLSLLKHGIDINAQNDMDQTALQKMLLDATNTPFFEEIVTMLLVFGADPFIKYRGYNAFELSVKFRLDLTIQTQLFHLIYDNIRSDVHFCIVVILAKVRSEFLYQIFETNVRVVYKTCLSQRNYLKELMALDLDRLKIILEHCGHIINRLVDDAEETEIQKLLRDQFFSRDKDLVLEKLDLFIHSGCALGDATLTYLTQHSWDSHFYCNTDESKIPERIIYPLSYGATFDERSVYNEIYKRWGYGDLFKFLLQVDWIPVRRIVLESYKRDLVPILICNIDLNLDYYFFEERMQLLILSMDTILDYFAHPFFKVFLVVGEYVKMLSKDAIKRLMKHPNIPLLKDLARNAARKYLVDAFKIKRRKDFYTLLKALPIPEVLEKIISFETKLYFYDG